MVRLSKSIKYIDKAQSIGSFGENFVAGLSGLVLFVFTAMVGIGEAVANFFIAPTDATTAGIVAMIGATLEGPALFMQDAWNTAAITLGLDPWLELGPFIALVGIVVVISVVAIVAWYLDWSNRDAIGGWEVPWINNDSEGPADDGD